MTVRKAVIDTDPGIDDAVAILCALGSPELDVLGLTTVAGNIGIATVTRNAGRILALAGRREIPVLSGADGPLARKGFDTAEIHGDDGLGGVLLPEPAKTAQAGAVEWLAETLLRETPETVAILALGPLTNIARLVREHPLAARRVGRIIAMGGAIAEPGNIGPRSEYNIAADPEAAAIVFSSGLPLTLVPLDVTRRVRASRAYTALLRQAGKVAATTSADLIEAYFHSTTGGESRPLHDPCVMLYALRPDLFGCETMTLDVDVGHGADAGALTRAETSERPALDVAMTVDAAAALALLAETLRR